eukprot:3033057-Alexandrium_andersonii.AAC.1
MSLARLAATVSASHPAKWVTKGPASDRGTMGATTWRTARAAPSAAASITAALGGRSIGGGGMGHRRSCSESQSGRGSSSRSPLTPGAGTQLPEGQGGGGASSTGSPSAGAAAAAPPPTGPPRGPAASGAAEAVESPGGRRRHV